MICLDTIQKSLKASVSPIDKEVHFVVYYAKKTVDNFIESSELGQISGSTNVLLSPSNPNEILTIKDIFFYNASNADVSINLFISDSLVDATLYKIELKVDKTWRMKDSNVGKDGLGIDHITTIDNLDGTKTLYFWGDSGETISLGEVTLEDGVDGTNGTNGTNGLNGTNGTSISVQTLSQASYDALSPSYDPNKIYIIV